MLELHDNFISFRNIEGEYKTLEKSFKALIEQDNKRLSALYPTLSFVDKDFILLENFKISRLMKFEEAYLVNRSISVEGNLKKIYSLLEDLDLLEGKSLDEMKEKYPSFINDENRYLLIGDDLDKKDKNPGNLIADCTYFVLFKI